jgi:hypothetical protein
LQQKLETSILVESVSIKTYTSVPKFHLFYVGVDSVKVVLNNRQQCPAPKGEGTEPHRRGQAQEAERPPRGVEGGGDCQAQLK